MDSSDEQRLFQDGNASVSTSRVILNGTTYPLSNVSSVRLLFKPKNLAPVGITGFLAALFALSKVWLLAIIFVVIAIIVWRRTKVKYTLLLGTAGGEKSALVSSDSIYMRTLEDKINTAIVRRG